MKIDKNTSHPIEPSLFSLEEYNYLLPEELIAQEAIHPHHDARVIVIDKNTGGIKTESTFWNLDTIIPPDRVMFLNNSRVLPARIPLKWVEISREDGTKSTIQNGEILFCKMLQDDRFEAMVRPGAKFRKNTKIHFPEGDLKVIEMSDTGRILKAEWVSIFEIMKQYGELPLPPYIEYTKSKEEDYQTTFAKKEGSVAAPTASLHFTQELLAKLPIEKKYVTLHVGLGTFKGIDTDDVRDYQIHGELIEVDISLFSEIYALRRLEKKILAIGTTVCRTLESLPHIWNHLTEIQKDIFPEWVRNFWNGLTENLTSEWVISDIHIGKESILFESRIYIYPGVRFLLVDDLITNFHLPKSSLLVLISAFLGKENTRRIYEYAIKERYRFFSFGDGMYIRSEDDC